MSKSATPELDRRLLARLAAAGEPAVLIAQICGLPRLEVEAALSVDADLADLRAYYQAIETGSPKARAERIRRLTLAAIEHRLERGELTGLGWALRPYLFAAAVADADEPGRSEESPSPAAEDDPAALEALREREIDEAYAELSDEMKALWDSLGYERWPVPPTIPWRPGAPRPRGPLEIDNEAGTEAERAAEPIPWPPRAARAPAPDHATAPEHAAASDQGAAPDRAAPPDDGASRDGGGVARATTDPPPSGAPSEGGEPGGRWPPHLRPL
ncbi:MAG: hypothetical protein RMK81_10475 [Geminicoccaceae bacterium]|nr:DUF3135 domain-containing protein [Geminicoccaceae bacterium]MDW8370685.1 hypothetical protein [Geminicoccaceae bacterium]